MFEHIYFFTHQTDGENQDVLKDEAYQKMVKMHHLPSAKDTSFCIDGKSRYLLKHPMSLEKQKYLMYLQSFSYMDTGASYYTKRSNYPSILLLYTYEGIGELIYRGQRYTLRKGDGFVIDCREAQFYKTMGNHWCHSDLHFWGRSICAFLQRKFCK